MVFTRKGTAMPSLKQLGPEPVDDPVHHRCRQAVDDDRPGDGEHLGPQTQDKTFCLCQVRTQCFLSNRLEIIR